MMGGKEYFIKCIIHTKIRTQEKHKFVILIHTKFVLLTLVTAFLLYLKAKVKQHHHRSILL